MQMLWEAVNVHVHSSVPKLSVMDILSRRTRGDVPRGAAVTVPARMPPNHALWPRPSVGLQPSQLMHHRAYPGTINLPTDPAIPITTSRSSPIPAAFFLGDDRTDGNLPVGTPFPSTKDAVCIGKLSYIRRFPQLATVNIRTEPSLIGDLSTGTLGIRHRAFHQVENRNLFRRVYRNHSVQQTGPRISGIFGVRRAASGEHQASRESQHLPQNPSSLPNREADAKPDFVYHRSILSNMSWAADFRSNSAMLSEGPMRTSWPALRNGRYTNEK